tara:strand:+ start:530 stop:931 length:402 start_codon:yes stop_codon:yes gene_type:complete
MNEQAIQDAYKLFVEQGYGKSIDDFKKLISTNPDALNDSYNLFKSQGYAKSIDDYSSLMGVGAQSQGELVKKDYKGLMGISADIQVKKKNNLYHWSHNWLLHNQQLHKVLWLYLREILSWSHKNNYRHLRPLL